MSIIHIYQSQEEYDYLVATHEDHPLFFVLQSIQGVVAVLGALAQLCLTARHKRLHTRAFYLLCMISIGDLLFGLYLVIFVCISPLSTGQSIPFGRGACQFYGWWTIVTLIDTLSAYAVVAYERYRAIVTPLHTPSLCRLWQLWLVAVALSMIVATALLVDGGFRAEPSGLYCNANFAGATNPTLVLAAVLALLASIVYFYSLTALRLRKIARSTLATDASAADADWARSAMKLVSRLALLPTIYVLIWTPAVLMIMLRIGGASAGYEPQLDVAIAIVTVLGTSTTFTLNLALFPPLRHALADDLRRLRRAAVGGAWSDAGSTRAESSTDTMGAPPTAAGAAGRHGSGPRTTAQSTTKVAPGGLPP